MDPSTGTFTSMDTYGGSLEDPMSLHKYLFANSNPVKWCDPSGHAAIGESTMSLAECLVVCDLLAIMCSAMTYTIEAFVQPNGFETHSVNGLCKRIADTIVICLVFDMIVVSVFVIIDLLLYENEISDYYYHVTTQERAEEIINLGRLEASRFESKVFAFNKLPTQSQAMLAGLGDKAQVVIRFVTNASWEVDTYVNETLREIAVRTTDGQRVPIDISNPEIVDFYSIWRIIWNTIFG